MYKYRFNDSLFFFVLYRFLNYLYCYQRLSSLYLHRVTIHIIDTSYNLYFYINHVLLFIYFFFIYTFTRVSSTIQWTCLLYEQRNFHNGSEEFRKKRNSFFFFETDHTAAYSFKIATKYELTKVFFWWIYKKWNVKVVKYEMKRFVLFELIIYMIIYAKRCKLYMKYQ